MQKRFIYVTSPVCAAIIVAGAVISSSTLIPSCAALPAASDPFAKGQRWVPPVGCTTPWGIEESAQSAANIKRIDEFPADEDWVNVSGNGEPDNPLVIVGDLVVTKMVRIREGSSYLVLDGLTIHPEPSRDFGWEGSGVLIEGGTHHIALRNCILRSTTNADVASQSSTPSGANAPQHLRLRGPLTDYAQAVPVSPTKSDPGPSVATLFRTLLTTTPSRGRSVEYVTVFNCKVGPLGDWTQDNGTDHVGLSFPAGTKHVCVLNCSVSDIGGDAIAFPSETMFADRGGAEFPATDIQIGRCHLQRCKEELIDGKLVQDMIISECSLEKTNSFSTTSRGNAIAIHVGSDAGLEQIINDHGGTLQWMSPDNVWLLFNDIRDLSQGAIFATASFTPDGQKGTLYSVGNKWTNIHAEGRGNGTGLTAWSGNMILSTGDTFSNVDRHTSNVVMQDQIPREAFRQKFGRDLGETP